MPEVDNLIEKHISELSLSLNAAVEAALNDYEDMQNAGRKGELSHIYMSFLRSAVLCKQPWMRIDLYDDKDVYDLTECSAKWDVPEISSKLYLDADDKAKKNDIVEEYRVEQMWFELSEEYCKAFETHAPEIIRHSKVATGLKCQWHYGNYLGDNTTVYGATRSGKGIRLRQTWEPG